MENACKPPRLLSGGGLITVPPLHSCLAPAVAVKSPLTARVGPRCGPCLSRKFSASFDVEDFCLESGTSMFPHSMILPTSHTEGACCRLTLAVDNLSDKSNFEYFMSARHATG